jgi:hypothetical protein
VAARKEVSRIDDPKRLFCIRLAIEVFADE